MHKNYLIIQVKKRKKKSESEEESILSAVDSSPIPPRKTAGRARKPISYAVSDDDEDDSN